MIPIKLTVQAFGPYKDKEVIDFSKFFQDRLFLITGNTGSGKTMIFDAICYALFGKVSGQYREIDTLRSQFADEKNSTYVEFEFSHRNKNYIITRQPEQFKISRNKKVLQRAKAQILIDDEMVSGVKKVDYEIENILGIDYSQFKQIVMIAQGEFRKLVSADSKEREVIYRQIFNTMEFDNIQKILKEKSADYEKRFENFDQRIKGLLDSISSIKLISYEDLTMDQILNILKEEMEVYDNKSKGLKPDKEYYKNEIMKNNNFLDCFNSLVARKKELLAFDVNSLKDESNFLDKVNKTFLIRDKEKVLENFKDTRDEYEKEKEKIICDLNSEEKNLETLNKEFEKIKSYDSDIENLKSRIIEIESLRDTVEEKGNIEREIIDLEAELSRFCEKIKYLKEELKMFNLKYDENLKFIIEHKDIKDKILHMERDILNIEGIEEGLNKYELELEEYRKLGIESEKCETEYNRIHNLYENKLKDLSQSEDIYFRNQAGFLANKLKDGSPCIVCGSTIHPNKASLIDSDVSEEFLKKLRDEISKIEKDREKVVTIKINLNKDVKSKSDRISEIYDDILKRDKEKKFINFKEFEECGDSILKVKSDLIFLKNSLIDSQNINSKLIELQEEILNVESKIKEIKLEINDHEKSSTKIESNISALKTILEDRTSRLSKHNISSTDEYIKILKQTNEDLKCLSDKREVINSNITKCNNEILKLNSKLDMKNKDIVDLNSKIEVSHKSFMESLNENEFKNIDEYQKFKISESEFNDRTKFIESKREEFRNIKSKVAQLEKDLSNAPYKTKEELSIHLENLNNKLKGIEKYEIEYHQNKSLLENVYNSILSINKDISNIENLRVNLNELNKIANGINKYKISFERYILGIYFKEIIQAANIRLSKLTNGRFLFRHLRESTDMRSQQGLEISVFDNKTSKERKITAISGGESFQASLALALGLSDVIQRYSGGVSIDTLFIDEGFGSLDSDSLQNALECLIEANDESKLIGIISHVQELKDFIKSKIEIIDSNTGSRIKMNP